MKKKRRQSVAAVPEHVSFNRLSRLFLRDRSGVRGFVGSPLTAGRT